MVLYYNYNVQQDLKIGYGGTFVLHHKSVDNALNDLMIITCHSSHVKHIYPLKYIEWFTLFGRVNHPKDCLL